MYRVYAVICLFVMSAIALPLTTGCHATDWSSAKRQRRRQYAIETDLDNLTKDLDYVFGLRNPSGLVDETSP
jgi:hypothetical protein